MLASLPTLYFMLLMLSVEDQRLVDIRLDPRIPRRRPPAVPGGPRRHPFDLAYYALSLAAPLASIPLSRHPGWRWLAEAAVWCSGGSVPLAPLAVQSGHGRHGPSPVGAARVAGRPIGPLLQRGPRLRAVPRGATFARHPRLRHARRRVTVRPAVESPRWMIGERERASARMRDMDTGERGTWSMGGPRESVRVPRTPSS